MCTAIGETDQEARVGDESLDTFGLVIERLDIEHEFEVISNSDIEENINRMFPLGFGEIANCLFAVGNCLHGFALCVQHSHPPPLPGEDAAAVHLFTESLAKARVAVDLDLLFQT